MRGVLIPVLVAMVAVAVGTLHGQDQRTGAPQGTATFKSGVDLVTVSAVVRDRRGRLVTNLTRADFELLDGGQRRSISQFRPDAAPLSIAFLFDASGSMQVASKIDEARAAARQMLSWLETDRDEVAIYAFDSGLKELQPFTPYRRGDGMDDRMGGIEPFGMTSLHDAVAETARRVARRNNVHRAVIVLTDGLDNNSRLSAPEVSGIASAIDVPVYILAVVSPLDHQGTSTAVTSDRPVPVGDLADLARWTGGDFFVSSTPANTSVAVRQIVSELRHQYLIAFEPTGAAGWHSLELRTHRRDLVVRARTGYMAGQVQSN